MDRSSILTLLLFLIFLAVVQPGAKSQLFPPRQVLSRPLCASQFALVNHACAALPYVPIPPPSTPEPPVPVPPVPEPPALVPPPVGGRISIEEATPVEEDCCKWLETVDDECVCDILVRLPSFLSRPVHEYTVIVGETCNVTYACSSRIIPGTH